MSCLKVSQFYLSILAALCLAYGAGAKVEAKTLFVANNGLDIATCGAIASPCRTISKAIENAGSGDRIIVGPGRYGDLDGDGTFNSILGEEKAETTAGSCLCMIKVNKLLRIESRDGAAATVLDTGGGVDIDVVRIETSGVVLGKPKKGFTLTGGGGTSGNGLEIASGVSGVRVEGNLSTRNEHGFSFSGSGHIFSNNAAIRNLDYGFSFSGTGHRLSRNLASHNNTGGFITGGNGSVFIGNVASDNGNIGFEIFDSGHVLSGNVASANGSNGFLFSGSGHKLSSNSALGNKKYGVEIDVNSTGHVLTGNSIVGNADWGIYLPTGSSATITKNNIYGNGEGLWNSSGTSITATNNFWGGADGPGDNPADGLYIGPNSDTLFTPFATKEFYVKTVTPVEEPGLVVPTDNEQSETTPSPSLTPIQFLKEMQTNEGLLFHTNGNVRALQLEITDLSGRTVYVSGFVKGERLSWARVNKQNRPIAGGVYLYRLTARDRGGNEIQSELRKLIIQR